MKNIFILAFILSFYISFAQKVIDGDTFHYNGKKYRLAYIDAPEISQPIVGQMAKQYLEKNISLKGMRVIGKDKYGRFIVVLGNLNYRMVSDGYAVVYRFFCKDSKFLRAEQKARNSKKGIYKYKFKTPNNYRHGNNNI